ncbi:hypothetical protein [Brasilonema sp. UFV-L1]|uniref:hypothetical protein n=1 Tax=Brasilonema sp. UFV-L1 TaxID=2234130 RepID=UPI00145CA33D|nr:hypothetical protein [Brasilonema sp. UFV-L1]NMG08605.1 hypothetical protein [Brasilonema sp. UFV-L1]
MRIITSSVDGSTPVTNTQAYSPSVPLSVYRDLARELQGVQAKLDALNAQNQHIMQENQLLRQEIAKAVESVLRLQKLVDSQATVNFHQASQSSSDCRTQTKRPVTATVSKEQVSRSRTFYRGDSQTLVFTPEIEISSPIPEPVFIEEQEVSYDLYSESEPSQIRGWWIIIGILLIIVLGFGAGYLIVRPLFESHSR